MKPFAITPDQISRIVGAVCADELSRGFNRHFDFLTIASWDGRTEFGPGGLDLIDEEKAACARRAAGFFGLPEPSLDSASGETLQDWAGKLGDEIGRRLTAFSFKSAARGDPMAAHEHRADEIFQDAAAAANIFYGRRRLLSFVAPHSLMGFELSILTPNLQQIDSLDVRGMTPEQISNTLSYGDVLIATPTLWRYMMRENLSAPDNTMAVSFGEALAPDLAADMRKAGFGVLRELYGSTETGLMGWRDDPTEPFILFDHWRHDNGEPVRISPDGGERVGAAMDFIEWKGERYFNLAGRRDGAVQVGAVNVLPDEVQALVKKHPSVADCAIRVDRRGDGVNRLVAHLVLAPGCLTDEKTVRDIDAWCRTNLRQQERPRIYHFHEKIPA